MIRSWLEKNKIFFETIFVAVVGVASIVFSIAQMRNSNEQSRIADLEMRILKQGTYEIVAPITDYRSINIPHHGENLEVFSYDKITVIKWFEDTSEGTDKAVFLVNNLTTVHSDRQGDYHSVSIQKKDGIRYEEIEAALASELGKEVRSVSIRDSSLIQIVRYDYLGYPVYFYGEFIFKPPAWEAPPLYERDYAERLNELSLQPEINMADNKDEIIQKIASAKFK